MVLSSSQRCLTAWSDDLFGADGDGCGEVSGFPLGNHVHFGIVDGAEQASRVVMAVHLLAHDLRHFGFGSVGDHLDGDKLRFSQGIKTQTKTAVADSIVLERALMFPHSRATGTLSPASQSRHKHFSLGAKPFAPLMRKRRCRK